MKKEENYKLPVLSLNEISKVENPIMNAGQLNMLLSDTPKNHIYKRPAKGGGEWEYVTGIYVKKILNMIFGWNWSFEVKQFEYNMDAGQCMVLGRLTATSNGVTITKEQFGRADIKFKTDVAKDESGKTIFETDKNGKQKPKKIQTNRPLDLGNDLKAATTDALKKCASELGVASDIYGAEEFKHIRVAGPEDEAMIRRMQMELSDRLTHCQDREMADGIRQEILDAEAKGLNTLDFYGELLLRFE